MRRRCSFLSPVDASRGMILIMVLWALFFLGALAVAIAAYVRPQLSLAGKIRDAALARALAESGVKRAMAGINNRAAFNVTALKDFAPDDDLIDEERKININTAPEDTLKRFFEMAAGLDPRQAEDITAAILDWRQPGEQPRKNGAKSDYYQALNPSYPCKKAPVNVLEELLLVKGVTSGIFKKIKNEVTIYGTGCININTADAGTLRSLGLTAAAADKIIRYRNGSDGVPATQDDHVFSDIGKIVNTLNTVQLLAKDEAACLADIIGKGLVCVRSEYFKGRSAGKSNREAVMIDFIFNRQGKINFWREE
ncbi:MAG: hypothetical protein WCI27_07655 [Candidatus Omnitrophota bacterium]